MSDHRAEAERAAKQIPRANTAADSVAFASEATAHALLAIEARLGALVEQQRLSNAIAAYQSSARDDFLTVDEQEDVAVYVNERIDELVYRRSGGETA